MIPEKNEVLLCYRGKYHVQVDKLAKMIRKVGLSVSHDNEILDGTESFDSEYQVSWININENTDIDTTWRAPLRQAVEHSELVVFLVNPHDISENVMNEISWTAEMGRYIFVVFDVPVSSISVETESIYVSIFQIMWTMATQKKEFPQFEYHVIAHMDPEGVDTRLEVLVNRIYAYLNKARSGLISNLEVDTEITMSDIKNSPWAKARERLQSMQKKLFELIGISPTQTDGDPYQMALDWQRKYEEGSTIGNGKIRPPGSAFSYPYETETQRFSQTEEIITRVRPGPYEIIPLFTGLVRQAATVELSLFQDLKRKNVIFIGTIPVTNLMSFIDIVKGDRYSIILLNSAFTDFVYQIIKVSVHSWKLLSGFEHSPASFSSKRDDVIETLYSSPWIIQGFYNCINKYAVQGIPGAITNGPPSPVYQIPLSIIDSFAERFMLAYGYMFEVLIDPAFKLPCGIFSKTRENFDKNDWLIVPYTLAAWITMKTAIDFDLVDPMIALQGCLMVLNCHDIIENAIDTLEPDVRHHIRQVHPSTNLIRKSVASVYLNMVAQTGMDKSQAENSLFAAIEAVQTPLLLMDIFRKQIEKEKMNGVKPSFVWH